MTERSTPWPQGVPCWVDVTVSDLKRSQRFYREVFGWEFTQSGPEFGHYSNALINGRTVAGMAPPMEGWEDSSTWVVYLASEDIDATHVSATAAGATPIVPAMEVGPFGWMGMWLDPAGTMFGAWQAKEHTGFQITGVNGSVAWCDLMSAEPEQAKEFFSKVFGYTYADLGGPDYVSFTVPDRPGIPAGGIGTAGDGVLPCWNVCFRVDDMQATRDKIEPAGGGLNGDIVDFEFGYYASASGPDGEMFVLFNPGSSNLPIEL